MAARARTGALHLTNEQLVYEVTGDGERLVVALSVADRPADLPAARAGAPLSGAAEIVAAGSDGARVWLPAHGWAVLDG